MSKILVVDDNEQNLDLLQVLLRSQGHQVETAANGREALDTARSAPPDLIISDILMPVMDGFTLCRQWRKDDQLKGIPFVFYTATYTDPKDEEFALSMGAERFVVKPQEPGLFAEMMLQVLEKHEAGQLVAPREPVEEETIYYREYNEALIRKLEDKMLQLEETNRTLSHEITERKRAGEDVQHLYERTRRDAETKTTLLQEIHHRVKNNLQFICSLIELQAEQIHEPVAVQALQDCHNRVRAMARVHDTLYQSPDLARVNLGDSVQELADYLTRAYEGQAIGIDLRVRVEDVSTGLDQAVNCGLILNELVSNAIKHAFPPGEDGRRGRPGKIRIDLCSLDDRVQLVVRDDGVGLPAHIDPQAGESLGLQIVTLLVSQLKGTLAAESATDKGTAFTIEFPLPI